MRQRRSLLNFWLMTLETEEISGMKRRLILRDLPSLREYRVAWEVGLDVRAEEVVVDV